MPQYNGFGRNAFTVKLANGTKQVMGRLESVIGFFGH